MEDIRELQPDEYAPFNRIGRGNTGYLFTANKEFATFLLRMSENNSLNKIESAAIREIRDRLGLLNIDEIIINNDDDLVKAVSEQNLGDTKEVGYQGIPREKLNTIEDKKGANSYPRNPQIAANALKLAGHSCEIDPTHITFIRKKDGLPYTEPHHFIPLSNFADFDYSLDVEENIISLCSHCHNKLHYGIDIENTLSQLYEDRKEELIKAGINVTFEKLLEYYK